MDITLKEINEDVRYILQINTYIKSKNSITLLDVIKYAHSISSELKKFCENNKLFLIDKDKGSIGKLIEFFIFGKQPNNNKTTDLDYGDIKTTHLKILNSISIKSYNAKERLTITNFGNPNNKTNVQYLLNKKKLNETKYYNKLKNGVIVVLKYENKSKTKSYEDILKKEILGIFHYNLDLIPREYLEQIENDFCIIKKSLESGKPTQKGQKFLHLHKHGTKNSETRAFGFTNKFLTFLISLGLNLELKEKGRIWYLNINS